MQRSISFLKKKSKKLREEIITMAFQGRGAHISSSLCIADILTVLYWDVLRVNPKKPNFTNRDRFILSKGHAASALFAILSQKGFFSRSLLKTYGKNGSMLGVHPEHTLSGIELSTGSLGHGLAVGAGMALAGKMNNKKYRVFVLISDAESQEGSIWETLLFAAHHNLDNLWVIIDYNKVQAFGKTNEIINLEPLSDKLNAFGWNTFQIDGHNVLELQKTFNTVSLKKKPSVVICNTVAGKGVSFMEHKILWHYHNLDQVTFAKAFGEINKTI